MCTAKKQPWQGTQIKKTSFQNHLIERYKQCIIEFERRDQGQAVCPSENNTVYILKNRVNCGTAFSGDECVVEVLQIDDNSNYARVIAVIERAEPIKYRRFICEPDDFEPYGMMKPLDKVSYI